MEEKKSKITLKKVDGQWILTIPWGNNVGTHSYKFNSYISARNCALSLRIERSDLA